MEIRNEKIDAGNVFDWGRTSEDYAKYRDIYPEIFYEKIIGRGLCVENQKVLDLGTGTGVLPRNMYRFGAKWTGVDISAEQIAQAERLSKENRQEIRYMAGAAEEMISSETDFAENTFDIVTACQCFWYFDHEKLIPQLARILKKDGRLLVLYMAWLPFEDKIAGESEALVLKYNPKWSGAGETMHPISVPDCVYDAFEEKYHEEYEVDVPFTRETWNGRMKACRGIGASLPVEKVKEWEAEHRRLLEQIAPEEFCVRHYGAVLELGLKGK